MSNKAVQQTGIPFVDVDNLPDSAVGQPPSGEEAPVAGGPFVESNPDTVSPLTVGLDSIFYIICALAGLGLVGSLYALISHNNAYFDREFEQLQRETAALNARLEQVSERDTTLQPAPEVAAPVTAVVTQPVVIAEEVNTEPEADTLSETTARVPDNSPDIVVDSVAPMRVPPRPVVSTDASVEIDALRAELNKLRSVVDAQEDQIQQLLRQDREVTATPVQESATVQWLETDDMSTDTASSTMPERAQAQTSMDPVTFAEAEPQISDSGMSDAYQAYQRQDYETALRIYQSVVQFDPYHRDASLGAAASAYRLADYVLAEQLYRHLLSLDALDGAAFAGLLNLVQQNPQRGIIELELQQHAEQHGRPSPLIMLLGNHFARLGRWRDAEVAFSQALQERSDDPDLVFNYAVVLDNLGQRQRAASYYQAAVEASTTSAHSFDLEGAKKRLQSLLSG